MALNDPRRTSSRAPGAVAIFFHAVVLGGLLAFAALVAGFVSNLLYAMMLFTTPSAGVAAIFLGLEGRARAAPMRILGGLVGLIGITLPWLLLAVGAAPSMGPAGPLAPLALLTMAALVPMPDLKPPGRAVAAVLLAIGIGGALPPLRSLWVATALVACLGLAAVHLWLLTNRLRSAPDAAAALQV